MSEPTRSERTAPPKAAPLDTASSADEHTAGLGASSPSDNSLSFLERPQSKEELGRLGSFRILKELGRGGMGCVLLAEDTGLERQVALKVMLPRFAQDEKAKTRFLREARAAGKLQHDNVVTIHAVGEASGVPYIAMEFLKGMPLDKYLKEKGDLPLPIVQKIGREIGLGLDAAHKLGMIHRDIKPANVWLESLPAGPGRKAGSFRVKILDFGLARREEDGEAHLTQSGAIVGTPAYMAPEQASGEKLDGRADLFSLGVLLYRLTTGQPAFTGPTTTAMLLQVMTHEPSLASEVKATVPLEMARIIAKLMAKKKDERYASATEFLADWEKMAKAPKPTEAAPTMVRPSDPESPARGKRDATQNIDPPASTQAAASLVARARTMRLLLLAGVPAVLAITVALWFFVFRSPGENQPTPPIVINAKEPPPLNETNAQEVQAAWASKLKAPVEEKSATGVVMMLIPPGELVPYPYYMGKYEVTQGEWATVMGPPVGLEKQRLPKADISWYDSVEFCNKLSEREKLPPYYALEVKARTGALIEDAEVKILGGPGYHIPTDAEWEHGCRAGTKTKYCFGDDDAELAAYAWYDQNSEKKAHPVGELKANGFGLYDIHGNVREWNEEMLKSATTGAPESVNRGGNWYSPASNCAVGNRARTGPASRYNHIGLRLARVPSAKLDTANAPAKEPPPLNATNAKEVQAAWAAKLKLPVESKSPSGIAMMLIPPGDLVQHPYLMGKYEVTQAEWELVMGYNPSNFKKGNKVVDGHDTSRFPVENVSWYDCIDYCNKLSEKEGLKPYYQITVTKRTKDGKQIDEGEVRILGGPGYHLPTETEWEHACRSGSKTDYHFGNSSDDLTEHAWFMMNSDRRPHPVGQKKPNGSGLHDMHGNIREWLETESINVEKPVVLRKFRSSTFADGVINCKVKTGIVKEPATRHLDAGFRLARNLPGVNPKAIETTAAEARKLQQDWAAKLKMEVETKSPSGIVMMVIPPGDALPKPYLMGKYEVTQAEWEAVMGYNPSTFQKGNKAVDGLDTSRFPVDNVSWYESVEYCNKLSEKEGLKPYYELKVTKLSNGGKRIEEADVKILGGAGYHLPTDEEWTWACAAGANSKFYYGDNEAELSSYAWFKDNSNGRPHTVGEKKSNVFGLYDMAGNILEWTELSTKDSKRVVRGGFYENLAYQCELPSRHPVSQWLHLASIGLRLARTPADASAAGRSPLWFRTPAFDPWVKATAALTGKKQIEAINAKLKELNPTFTGSVGGVTQVNKKWQGVGEQDVVERLGFSTLDNLRDLSPVRACAELREITGNSTRINTATLSDLAPLAGMKLAKLDLWNTLVADLTPLEGMPLTDLNVGASQVVDLTPLKGMKLTKLIIASTRVSDLTPLTGMPLIYQECQGAAITDLTPLKGMLLSDLGVGGLRIQKGLEVLKEMPLQKLTINPGYNIEFLRNKPTLTTINNRPVAEYWK